MANFQDPMCSVRGGRAVLAAMIAASLLGGCAAPLERRPATEEAFVGNQSGSWELVFDSPTVSAGLGGVDRSRLAEFSRADARLNNRPGGPLLASNQWPEADRASLAYPRRVSLPMRPESLLFFEGQTERGGYRGDGAGAWRGGGTGGRGAGDGGGTWGFWR